MRSLLIASILLLSVPSLAAAQGNPCAELQRACEMKNQLGEKGEGNCKAARACQARACKQLRRACLFKEERGEQGEGNCRRYREVCR